MPNTIPPIRRGFNRIALFGFVPLCVLAVGFLGFAAITRMQAPRTETTVVYASGQTYEMPGRVGRDELRRRFGEHVYPNYPRETALSHAERLAGGALLLAVLAGLWLAFWAGIGWVAAGFQREPEA